MNFSTARVLALAALLGGAIALQSAPSFAGNNRQVFMERAIQHLLEARRELEKASRNKGGHRVKAIQLTDMAIDEVKRGMRFAKTH
ncbi:hypothetical protein [Rhodobium gokarnense]|uniref:Uncharacterized protein n=1 Tax=Rhodobium gokarnense TaxID=364296 RepID=A0ABT3HB60_9HYPH|nr:hypothetical protein [Rhodobium gokarnense]MCW2307531.1 hypothetical protein [Rhodobium gokarnense]